MGKHQQSKERYARIVTKKEKLIVARKKNKNITNMKLLAILFVAEVILIASCETSKKVKEVKPEAKKAVKTEETSKEVKEVKSEAEKVAKKSSLKERLQDIAKKGKRAKSYYSTSGWWNHRTTSYPYYDRTYGIVKFQSCVLMYCPKDEMILSLSLSLSLS